MPPCVRVTGMECQEVYHFVCVGSHCLVCRKSLPCVQEATALFAGSHCLVCRKPLPCEQKFTGIVCQEWSFVLILGSGGACTVIVHGSEHMWCEDISGRAFILPSCHGFYFSCLRRLDGLICMGH